MTKSQTKKLLTPLWLMGALIPGGSVLAQANGQPAETPPADASAATGDIGDIVVTAQKREQRLQDVGLTVTALGGETLAAQGVKSVGDLTKVVPGLNATPSPSSTPIYILRGVGFFESTVAAYPDVATYIDQAPLPLPVFSALTAFDLERVEVLKGPQGTLFGNNATGGAINFVAAKPTASLKAGVNLGYSRFNTVDVNGFVSGPLSDTLRARVAFSVTKGDGWQRSYTRDDKNGEANKVAGRLLLDWTPTDRLSLSLNVNGWIDRSESQAPQLARQITPADLQKPIGTCGVTGRCITANDPLLSYPVGPRSNRFADWDANQPLDQDNRLAQVILNGRYELTDDISLTTITNYIDYEMFNSTELDGTALQDVRNDRDVATAHDFSQEVRLESTGRGNRFRWVLGGNYDRGDAYELIDLFFKDATSGSQQGFSNNTYTSDQHMRNLAAFANAEFDIVPALTVKGGIRYTDARRRALSRSLETPGYVEPYPNSPGLLNFVNFAFANFYQPTVCPTKTTLFTPIPPGVSITIDPATCISGDFRDTLRENNVSWSVGADFKPRPGLLFYVNVSKGYKAGSYPIASAASKAQLAAVTQESLLDYEAGFKARLFDGLASFNGAVFYYDYTDKQLRSKTVDTLFGQLDLLVNVPKSRVKGAEFDILVRPTPGLDMRFAGTYLDAEVTRFNGVVGTTTVNGLNFPVRASYAGAPLPFAPKFQFTATADYTTALSSTVNGFAGVTVAGQTKSYGSPQIDPQQLADVKIKGYMTLDLRAGLRSADDGWSVMVWGRNVTNSYYWTNALRGYDSIVRYTGRPAEYGITLGWKL